jgi:hypothetical protein
MRTKIPVAVLGGTLQVAAFLNLPTGEARNADSAKAALLSQPDVTGEAVTEIPVAIEFEETGEINAPTTFRVQPEWDKTTAHRFKQLAEREALGVASSEEIEELEYLSEIRRRSEAPRSGEDVLREYEQGQLIRDLLQSLKRYVEFEQRTASPKTSMSGRGAKAATKTS